MLKLYDNPESGNCYKIRLLLSQLRVPYEKVHVGLMSEGPRSPEFLDKTPIGRVPVVELDDGRIVVESNAILFFLASGTPLLPEDPFERIRILQWLFFEQNGLEPNIGTVRYWTWVVKQPERYAAAFEQKREAGNAALGVMDRYLQEHEFLVGGYSIADIALYAYAHVAPQGGFDLAPHPAVRAWLGRVEAQPGYVKMIP